MYTHDKQFPYNFRSRAHDAIGRVIAAPRWAPAFPESPWRTHPVQPLGWYVELLMDRGLDVDAWETIYHHPLGSADEVLEWLKGTTLRPFRTRLSIEEYRRLLDDLRPELEREYPRGVYPFHRIFIKARR